MLLTFTMPIFLIGLSFFIQDGHTLEKANSFLITLYENHTKVISPQKYYADISVIIENKTLNKIIGKVEIESRNLVKYVSIPGESFRSVDLPLQTGDRPVFIPLAPAFQEVPLVFGAKVYEIPEKQKIELRK